MMKRRVIEGVACVGLTLFLVGAIDARVPSTRRVAPTPSRGAQVKPPSSAASTAGAAAGVAAGAAAATALHLLTPTTPAAAATPGTPPVSASSAMAPAVPNTGGVGAGAVTVPPPAAAPSAPPTYHYSPAGKSDPFVPFIEIDLAVKRAKEKKAREEALKKRAAASKRPISPLQQAEIGQFRLVGIAGDDTQRMAIVEDGVAKKFYPLSVGTYIGLNGGRIVSILPDRLIVEEPLQDESGKGKKVQTRRMTVMLHKEEEGKP